MPRPTKAQAERQDVRGKGGRYQEYDRCPDCGHTITDKTGWCHISDEPGIHPGIKAAGKDPSRVAMICGKCATRYSELAAGLASKNQESSHAP